MTDWKELNFIDGVEDFRKQIEDVRGESIYRNNVMEAKLFEVDNALQERIDKLSNRIHFLYYVCAILFIGIIGQAVALLWK